MKNWYYAALWIATAISAALLGGFGGWMVTWASGGTTTVHVDNCYEYYSMQEVAHTRCEGYWQLRPGTGSQEAVRGPVVGVHVDSHAKLADPTSNPSDFGDEISSSPHDYLATLNGDAAIVIPRSHLVLGPVGAVLLIACGVTLVMVRRRDKPDDLKDRPAPLAHAGVERTDSNA